ncbi:uncharacterized protein TM35_000083310 [Trypanosoma theileri]|uniref:Uncharacterized protein n=1 Tax=Trypanosoma theileri TaxID=67003 RepID=A0A1X0P1F6_9TRYP|nr:uncharacterized protein TM35_000083310 [Trypanosoma theileri]ORC90533.1 hypothetical protein TM35_000083310 [Trypanosoma theileri]
MSLFDDDLSSSVSSCENETVEDDCNLKCKQNGVESLPGVAGGLGAKTVGSSGIRFEGLSRFTLTVDEKKRAEERWRMEVAGSSLLRAAGTGGGNSGSNPPHSGGSRFSSSIAEALQLRKEATEALRMRRIQKQRQEELKDEELVKKDREVGVFVTPEYMEALRRQKDPHHFSEKDEVGGVNVNKSDENKGQEDEEDDPLEKYLQQLEERRSTTGLHSVSLNSSACVRKGTEEHEGMVSIPGEQEEESVVSSMNHVTATGKNHDVTFNGAASSSSLIPNLTTGIEEGGTLPTHDGSRSDEFYPNNVRQSSAMASESKNEVRPEDALREAREIRKRRRVDLPFIQAATERFITRALERLEAN